MKEIQKKIIFEKCEGDGLLGVDDEDKVVFKILEREVSKMFFFMLGFDLFFFLFFKDVMEKNIIFQVCQFF